MRPLALGLLLGAAGAAGAAAEPPTVKACGHHDYPPWNWLQGGRIVGACADVAQRAIERLGYRVDLSYVGPWARCQALVESGQVDVNICSFRNPEREAYSVFATPRMGQNRIAVFVGREQAQTMRVDRWRGLAGARTGLVLGVSMGPEFDDFLEQQTRVSRVANFAQALNMLAIGRLDIVPFGWEAGQIQVERAGLAERIVPLAEPALVGDLWVSVSRKSPLAARIGEIGAYFTRPGYREELEGLLLKHARNALAPAESTPVPR